MIPLGSVPKGFLETSNLTEKVLKTANFGWVLLMVPGERLQPRKIWGTASCWSAREGGGEGRVLVMEAQINDLCPKRDIPGYESLFRSLPPE
jgi:hypothetical protein